VVQTRCGERRNRQKRESFATIKVVVTEKGGEKSQITNPPWAGERGQVDAVLQHQRKERRSCLSERRKKMGGQKNKKQQRGIDISITMVVKS